MQQAKIWLDCDGVLADTVSPYLGLLNMITGRRHRYEDVTSFRFSACVASVEEDAAVWVLIDRSPGFVKHMAPVTGALDGLQQLRALGHKLGCLTSPHYGPHWVPERAAWLMARGFTKKQIHFSSAKEDVPGCILIEDFLANLVTYKAEHPQSLAVLINQPWNQGCGDFVRVHSWGQAVRVVKQFLAERGPAVDAVDMEAA